MYRKSVKRQTETQQAQLHLHPCVPILWITLTVMTCSYDLSAYLSSQYMVLMRYSCWMLSTGHRSVVISSRLFFGLLPITRNVTACRMYFTSSQLSATKSAPATWIQVSTCASPVLTYSPAHQSKIHMLREPGALANMKCRCEECNHGMGVPAFLQYDRRDVNVTMWFNR